MDKMSTLKRIALAAGTSALLVGTVAVPAFAASATDGGTTSATVNAVLSVTAPATLDFGAGAPGATLHIVDAPVTVITNNAAGYQLAVQATPMTGPGTAIPVSKLSFRDAATAFAPLVTASIDVVLASPTAMTSATGTTHDIDANLDLPFIAPGDYAGTFLFTVSTL